MYNCTGFACFKHEKANYSQNKQIKDLATVITNLLSAVPFFGQDLVESNNITKLYSCLIHMNNTIPVLGTIGTVSQQALKKRKKNKIR